MTGTRDEQYVNPRLQIATPALQRVVRVTEAVVAKSGAFRFAADFHGLQVIPEADTPMVRHRRHA